MPDASRNTAEQGVDRTRPEFGSRGNPFTHRRERDLDAYRVSIDFKNAADDNFAGSQFESLRQQRLSDRRQQEQR
jgi:hypothetical protein